MEAQGAERFVFVRCQVFRGAFSAERVFGVPEANGYTGIAPVHYVRKIDDGLFLPSEPAENEAIPGKLFARMIKNGGDSAQVAIPDGEAITVPLALISRRAADQHVSVRS